MLCAVSWQTNNARSHSSNFVQFQQHWTVIQLMQVAISIVTCMPRTAVTVAVENKYDQQCSRCCNGKSSAFDWMVLFTSIFINLLITVTNCRRHRNTNQWIPIDVPAGRARQFQQGFNVLWRNNYIESLCNNSRSLFSSPISGIVRCGSGRAWPQREYVSSRPFHRNHLNVYSHAHPFLLETESAYYAEYPVSQFRINGIYNAARQINDIAIVQTASAITYNMGVGPACLPFK